MTPSRIITTLKWAGIASIILAIIFCIKYVIDLKADNVILTDNNKLLTNSINEQKKTITNMTDEISQIKVINNKLNKTVASQYKEIQTLNEKFKYTAKGTSRDFGAITRVKPTLVNKLINDATKNVNRCFELATGAVIKEGEVNNECKELINNLTIK